VKEIFAPHLGKNVKLGGYRHNPYPGPHFRLKNYLMASLPAPPTALDWTKSASAVLADVYGNDSMGDCVIAALFHLLGVWTGNAGAAFHATLAEIIAMYSAIGNYVPGDPSTDNGCDMTTALNWIVAHGFPNGDKPLGWVRIDATNKTEVQQAIYLFEGIDFGVGLPDKWISPFPSANGFTWDVAGDADPNNGHSFMAAGYDTSGVTIDTWGLLGKLTYAAIAKYAVASSGGELDILLSADMIAKAAQKAPNGFDWQSLVADFDSMGGTVPVPAPPAPPAPTPPSGPVTLLQAQSWATAALNSGAPLMSRSQAVALANAGLAKSWPKS